MTALLGHHRHAVPSVRSASRRTGLWARLHGMALDRHLAAGIPSWTSPEHAARSLQLTSRRQREGLARNLESMVACAEHRRPATRMALIVAPSRSSVLATRLQMIELVDVLRGPAPVSAEGMALLRTVLTDGAGPLYCSHQSAELERALHRVSRVIMVPD